MVNNENFEARCNTIENLKSVIKELSEIYPCVSEYYEEELGTDKIKIKVLGISIILEYYSEKSDEAKVVGYDTLVRNISSKKHTGLTKDDIRKRILEKFLTA